MARIFKFRGKTLEELAKMPVEEFLKLMPCRNRRQLKKGGTTEQKKFLNQLRGNKTKIVKTHCRGMPVLPEMLERKIAVYNGKEFVYVTIIPEMLGHFLGEYALTRRPVKHSAAGIGATRSSKFIAAK